MSNLVALITGSSRGIGASCAIELAKCGINVVINYNRNLEKAKELENYIKVNYNVDVMSIKCDISKEEEVISMIDQIIDNFGKIDILVNIVLGDTLKKNIDKTVKDFRHILDVNLIGTFLCSKYVSKIMKELGHGKIINIASTNALDTYYPESADYDASKAGVISLTHNFAKELAPIISVNCICPGWVNTDMNSSLSISQVREEENKILLRRFADPKEIANVVVFLASSKSSYINNEIIRVDGGSFSE